MIHYAKIEGLIAPTFTSFNEDGEINTGIISAYAEKLRKKGLKGVFILGSSGEGMLMSVRERKTVTEVWAKERSDEFKFI